MKITIKTKDSTFHGTCESISSFSDFYIVSYLKLTGGREIAFDTYISGSKVITEIDIDSAVITLS